MAIALALAALALIVVLAWAAWARRRAAVASKQAALPAGELVSIDASESGAELVHLLQPNIYSERYGLSGRPDRVIRNSRGYVPVELKNASCPRRGPHPRELAQLAVYCLLLEERFQCTVVEGIMSYTDRKVTVPFDDRMRTWILQVIREVREAKSQNAKPRRSHDHRARCKACSYFDHCREALR